MLRLEDRNWCDIVIIPILHKKIEKKDNLTNDDLVMVDTILYHYLYLMKEVNRYENKYKRKYCKK